MARIAPSVARLMALKDVSEELAKHIRYIWKDAKRQDIIKALGPLLHHGYLQDTDYGRMLWINDVAGYHGVEYLGLNRQKQDVDFLNSGDCYTETLVFVNGRMFIDTTGDLLEKGYIKSQT